MTQHTIKTCGGAIVERKGAWYCTDCGERMKICKGQNCIELERDLREHFDRPGHKLWIGLPDESIHPPIYTEANYMERLLSNSPRPPGEVLLAEFQEIAIVDTWPEDKQPPRFVDVILRFEDGTYTTSQHNGRQEAEEEFKRCVENIAHINPFIRPVRDAAGKVVSWTSGYSALAMIEMTIADTGESLQTHSVQEV